MRDLYSAGVIIGAESIETQMAEVRNPASTSQVVGQVARGEASHAEHAIQVAHASLAQWSSLTVGERLDHIHAAFDEWNATLNDRARLLTLEQGKVLWESVADCRGPVAIASYFAEVAESVLSSEIVEDHRGRLEKHYVPFGVTSVVVPWNYPVYLSFQHILPALIAGNTVVVKPAQYAPLSLHWAVEILIRHLPAGVLNIVPGSGQVVGGVLSSHPLVRKVLFTGSLDVGREILKSAADGVKSVGLELGGNDPAVILPGFDPTDEAIDEIVRGVFTCSGQICFGIKRIYVPREHEQAFLSRFVERVDRLRVGPGDHPESDFGPMNNQAEFDRLRALIAGLRDSGAKVQELGAAVDPASWQDGYFLLPHVVTDVAPTHAIVTEEQFGPVIPVVAYDALDEVIEVVNSGEFGLGGSVWSKDEAEAQRVARRLMSGTVFVNLHRMGASDMTVPFGGMRQSGLGRTHGAEILLECAEPQVVLTRTDADKFPGPHLSAGM